MPESLDSKTIPEAGTAALNLAIAIITTLVQNGVLMEDQARDCLRAAAKRMGGLQDPPAQNGARLLSRLADNHRF